MTTNTGRYKHIVWDWNGTLLDDTAVCVGVVNGLLKGRRLPELTVERYREIFDFPVIDFYRRLGFDFDSESFDSLAEQYHREYAGQLRNCALQPDTERTVNSIARAGMTQSVLSAYQQDKLRQALEWFGLADGFANIIGLDDYYAHSKLDNGRRLVRQLKDPPGEILFVGDTLHDYEVAAAMGVECVLLSCGHQSPERLKNCKVPLLKTLSDLADWLKS